MLSCPVIGWKIRNFQKDLDFLFDLCCNKLNLIHIFVKIRMQCSFRKILLHCVDPKLWLGESWEFKKQKPVWSDNGMGHIPMLQSEYWIPRVGIEYKNLWQTLVDMIFPCLNFPSSFLVGKSNQNKQCQQISSFCLISFFFKFSKNSW